MILSALSLQKCHVLAISDLFHNQNGRTIALLLVSVLASEPGDFASITLVTSLTV